MGIFDGNDSNSPVPGGSLAKPVLIALGALLVGKMLSGKSDDDAPAAQPNADESQAGGGLLGGLGGLLGGALGGGGHAQAAPDSQGSLGGLLGGLGGLLGGALAGGNAQAAPDAPGSLSGGLGGLLDQLKQGGLGSAVDSWVGNGQNQQIDPGQLGSAIGHTTINDLAAKVGIDPQVLLDQLSQALPGVVDKLTQNGQVPDTNQLSRLLRGL